ncbi:MAG: hypothetical protein KC478_16825, partial [Bacteriovoracaceae bacterium]|nr:hypothetical protein [Bacteriovoracaceae bacterium]
FFDSAFVIKNSKDQFKLKGNQFIYEQIGTEHFFADLLNRRIMKCVEKGYTLYYEGKIERVGGIGGESTGMAIILGENYGRMMQVKGANLNSSSMLHKGIGQRVGVYGSFRTKIGVESGMYRIFLVDKVKLDP